MGSGETIETYDIPGYILERNNLFYEAKTCFQHVRELLFYLDNMGGSSIHEYVNE